MITNLEPSACATLWTIYNASVNSADPFWESVAGGATPERMRKMADIYAKIPRQIYGLIVQTNAHGLTNKNLEIGPELVSPEKRLLDLQIKSPELHADGSISFYVHMFGLMDANYNLIRIGGERQANINYLHGFKPVQNYVVIKPEHVTEGAISQVDYEALINYSKFWEQKQTEFLATKDPTSTVTDWTYGNAGVKKDIMALIPANDQFKFVVELTISFLQDDKRFMPNLNYIIQDIHNFTLLGKGVTAGRPVYIANGAQNPPVKGVALPKPEVPVSTMPDVPRFTVPALTSITAPQVNAPAPAQAAPVAYASAPTATYAPAPAIPTAATAPALAATVAAPNAGLSPEVLAQLQANPAALQQYLAQQAALMTATNQSII